MKLQIKNKRIKKFFDGEIVEMGEECLYEAHSLTDFSAPKLETMESYCLLFAEYLTHFSAPKLVRAGNYCHKIAKETAEKNTQ
jgi:hypothetical protein